MRTIFFRHLLFCQSPLCEVDCSLNEYCNMPLSELIEKTREMRQKEFIFLVNRHKKYLSHALESLPETADC